MTRRIEEAAQLLGKAAARLPNDASVQNNYGNVLRDLGRHAERAQRLRARARDPAGLPDAHYNRAVVLQDLRRFEDAIAGYDQTLAFKPDYAAAHNNRGVALQELGRCEEAVASYDRALAVKARLRRRAQQPRHRTGETAALRAGAGELRPGARRCSRASPTRTTIAAPRCARSSAWRRRPQASSAPSPRGPTTPRRTTTAASRCASWNACEEALASYDARDRDQARLRRGAQQSRRRAARLEPPGGGARELRAGAGGEAGVPGGAAQPGRDAAPSPPLPRGAGES